METFFIYILKCSGIIALFFLIYSTLLKQETFFRQNRYFLLSGIITALILPLLIYTKTVYIIADQSDPVIVGTASTAQDVSITSSGWVDTFRYIYVAGVGLFFVRFMVQLASLIKLIYSSKRIKKGRFIMVETQREVTPFSFFNYIVYNPEAYHTEALHTIIAHEKIHALQRHSLDIFLMHLFSIIFWVNPLVWGYKKAMKQNLEYIADGEAVKKISCIKKYQYLLLNTSKPNDTMALTNQFFNSLIKKRIVMLNRNKSQRKNLWKYGFILPFLSAFIFFFNIKTIAQVRVVEEVTETNGQTTENHTFVVDKNATNEDLKKLKAKIKKEGGTFVYKSVKRNNEGEIISIKIEFTSNKGSFVSGSYSDTDGIQPIAFGSGKQGGVFINSGAVSDHEAEVYIHGVGQHSDEDVMVVRKGKNKYKKSVKIEKIIDSDDHKGNVFIFDPDEDDAEPLVLINGKESTVKIVENMDTDDIEKIEVVKGEATIKKYGKKAKDGVIIVKTKSKDHKNKGVVIRHNSDGNATPLYIIDGKETTIKMMKELDPDDIKEIEVVKGKKAKEKYGEKGKDGVIVISTKDNK